MLLHEMFITEKYFNAFELEDKVKYAQEIWDMLQKSYAPIGGIRGAGFNSVSDMVHSNHMFKVGLSGGRPVLVVIYKNKGGGRKLVALGTDSSKPGLLMAKETIKKEVLTGRSYGEFSGPIFGTLKKLLPPEVLTQFLIPAKDVGPILKKDYVVGKGDDMKSAPNDPYEEYYYQREIGGHMHTKVAYGDPKNTARFH